MHLVRGAVLAMGTLLSTCNVEAGEPLRFMSFNIRYGTAPDGDNAWPKRRDLVFETVRRFDPDILGVQEALHFQLEELLEVLAGYGSLGVGRKDGRQAGEYAAILYRNERLKPTKSGTFWLADTPDQPGSLTWGNDISRICTWAEFEDRQERQRIAVYNTHWDHRSQESRQKSGAMLLERIAQHSHAELPVVLMGDFNAAEDNPAFAQLLSQAIGLRDTFRMLHPNAGRVGTFNGFSGNRDGGKIDAVLVSPQWDVVEATIDRTEKDGRYPSDHFPVTAVGQLMSSGD